MALKLKKDRNEDFRGQWFHVGFMGKGDDAKLVGWSDEDEAEDKIYEGIPKEGRVKVAPVSSPEFRQRRASLERKNRKFRNRDGTFPPEIDDRIMLEAMSQTVLLDWEGIELPDGTNGVYSPAKGLKAMSESRAFGLLITALAVEISNVRRETIEEDANALGNGSGGSSSGPSTSSGSNE